MASACMSSVHRRVSCSFGLDLELGSGHPDQHLSECAPGVLLGQVLHSRPLVLCPTITVKYFHFDQRIHIGPVSTADGRSLIASLIKGKRKKGEEVWQWRA